MTAKNGLDFTGFNAVAPDFDLEVFSAQKFNLPIGPISTKVSGSIPGGPVMLDKALGGEFRVVLVSNCQPLTLA